MKLILITLVAVVVGLMVGCESASRTSMFIPTSIPASVAVPPPAYSDAEVLGAVKGYLHGPGMASRCGLYARVVNGETAQVRRDTSNPDKYYVTVPSEPDFSWTFIGSLGKVISTSTGKADYHGC